MKALVREALANDPIAIFIQSSVLVLFVAVFVLVVARLRGKKMRTRYQRISESALED